MKKNSQLIKWMMGSLIVLGAVAFGMRQALIFSAGHDGASPFSSPKNFLQYLESFIGWASQNGTFYGNTLSSQNNPNSWAAKNAVRANQFNLNSSGVNASLSQGFNTAQGAGVHGNNMGANAGSNSTYETAVNPSYSTGNAGQAANNLNSGTNSDNLSGSNSGNGSENNSGDNLQTGSNQNSGNFSGNNSSSGQGNNSNGNSGNNSTNNPGGSQGHNSGGSTGNGSGGGSQNNSGNNSGGYSGCVVGCYPGCIPGCDPECLPPSCNLGINPNTLPTINPVPSDITVAQIIAQQNQNNASLAQLLASRQALVVPVRQQSQDSKFQTINPNTMQDPSTNQPPADVRAKINAHQVNLH
jgi:hypothetical protein